MIVVVTGDFNLDMLKNSYNKIKQITQKYGVYHQLIQEPVVIGLIFSVVVFWIPSSYIKVNLFSLVLYSATLLDFTTKYMSVGKTVTASGLRA